jgi:protein phosphatase 1 regulatory subunit 7
MEGLTTLVNLTTLDLGDNRIRKIECLDNLSQLGEFYCAKNKLTKIEGVSKLQNLYLLALQANFIERIEGLE